MNRMNKKILSLTLALSLVLAFGFSAFGAEKSKDFGKPPKELDISQEEWDVLRFTNIERAKEGLPLLLTFDLVQKAAKVRAEELGLLFEHTRPNGSEANTALDELGYVKINSYTAFAENIALGQGSAQEVVEAWMDSPGHRANILREHLRQLGVGFVDSGWAQVFVTDKESDAVSIDFNEELGYFTLKLKSGITAYAPYDPISSPTVDGEVTFNYPGALPLTGTKAPDDGWYYIRAMNNYLNIDTSGNAELRNNSAINGNQVYYVENHGKNQITLKLPDGRYLGIAGNLSDGVRVQAVDSPYLWNSYTENNNDIYSLRSNNDVRMMLNASGKKNTNGTPIILWTNSKLDAPNHAEFRFIPTSAPDKPITPSPTSAPIPVVSDNVTAVPSQTNFVMNGKPVSVTAAYTINSTNYLQLRAIAALLNGTVAQFDVGWDGQYAVIEPGKPYSGEVTKTTLQTTTNIRKSNTKFKLNGEVFSFEDARLIDGDTNYLQLREFAQKLSGTASQFNVYWDAAAGQAVIQPGVAYTGLAQ